MLYRPMLHQVMDHARRRFAPLVIFQIAGHGAIWMVRAIPDVVDVRALCCEFREHPVVQRIELGLGEKAARDARLIGEEEYKIAGLVEAADRFRRIRHPANPVLRPHVAVVMVDHAVAVEKRRRTPRGAAHCHGAPRSIACSISSQMPWATARWICCTTGVSSLGAIRR